MDWKFHAIFSFFLYAVVITLFGFPAGFSFSGFVLLVFSSMLPDVDSKKSVIRKIVFALLFYTATIFVWFSINTDAYTKMTLTAIFAVLSYVCYVKIPLRHRGKKSLHLWRYFVVISAASFILFFFSGMNPYYAFFISIGYGSHLVADKIKKF